MSNKYDTDFDTPDQLRYIVPLLRGITLAKTNPKILDYPFLCFFFGVTGLQALL
jgi:hypothetical protein